MAHQKWEYRTAEVSTGVPSIIGYEWNEGAQKAAQTTIQLKSDSGAGQAKFIEMMNRLGAEGWEVVLPLTATSYLFKRPGRS